jgi:uncharacterized protein YjbJ (UPF0337 family)
MVFDSKENAKERTEGKQNEWTGWAKEKLGSLTGNDERQVEGKAQQLKGTGQQESAKTKEHTKGTFEEVGGTIKNEVGRLIGNEQMQAEGKVTEKKGEARQTLNK